MKTTELKKSMKLKDGTEFLKGTEVTVSWDEGKPLVTIAGRNVKIGTSTLASYVKGFKKPSIATLERWNEEGYCLTVTGKRVEPDGVGSDGSPSWLLALGLI